MASARDLIYPEKNVLKYKDLDVDKWALGHD